MLTVVETNEFLAWYRQVWSDEERDSFVDWIASNPDAGDVIQGTRGLRKVRFAKGAEWASVAGRGLSTTCATRMGR